MYLSQIKTAVIYSFVAASIRRTQYVCFFWLYLDLWLQRTIEGGEVLSKEKCCL